MTGRNFKWSILFALIILFIFIVACTQKEPTSIESPEDNQGTFMNLAEMEQTLENFASVLPEALTNPELAKIVYDEAKRNEEDEPYALWSEIADKTTKSGKTLRKEVQSVLAKRSLGKKVDAESFTSAMDEVDYLQVYIHDFEDWDGASSIITTYTPLTVDDMDITEITVYDTLGQPVILDVSDDEWEPDYTIAVVGLNESALLSNGTDNSADGFAKLSKATADEGIYCRKIYVRKVRSMEPWHKGKGEMVVRQVDSSGGGAILANARVRNSGKKSKKCKYKRSGSFSLWNGCLRGDVWLTDTDKSVTIEVFEADIGLHDYVIEEATVSYPSWTITVTDEGKYYRCASYIRCSYDWSWGSDASYIFDCR